MFLLFAPSIFMSTPALFSQLPYLIKSFLGLVLSILLLYISIVDISKLYISTRICFLGFILGMLSTALTLIYIGGSYEKYIFLNHLYASILILLLMSAISIGGEFITKKTLLGLGDAQLAFMCAAWLGFKGIFVALSIACFIASISSILLLLISKTKSFQALPFAPFISLGAWSVWITGPNYLEDRFIGLLGYLIGI